MTPPLALDERRARAIVFDPLTDTATVSVGSGPPALRSKIAGALLVDEAGFLVGLDLRDDAGVGHVIMLGPHEAVAQVTPHAVEAHEDATGELIEVKIAAARNAIRAAEKNPYV